MVDHHDEDPTLFPTAEADQTNRIGTTATHQSANDRTLTSLALLQVNWDDQHRSHLDNFVPFAVEAMRRAQAEDYSTSQVKEAILEQFGIALPVSVVAAILKRVQKQHLGERQPNGRFRATQTAGRDWERLVAEEKRCQREQTNLAHSLKSLARDEFQADWTDEQAEDRLLDYIEDNASELLGAALRGTTVEGERSRSRGPEQVIVAYWIEQIISSDPSRFDYLLTLVKGSMLAAGTFLQVGLESERPFTKTTLILDTPVILKALGYEGDEARDDARETLALARKQKAVLACFDRTVVEVRAVLDSAADSLRRTTPYQTSNAVGRYFASQGMHGSDVERLAERVEVDLGRLGVTVTQRPEHVAYLTVDEEALEATMSAQIQYRTGGKALKHDLDALTAIHRLRANAAGDRIETCRAVLITTNDALVRVARSFDAFSRHVWPLATLQSDLATILWVKQPMAAPELPRHKLMAACVAVLSPSDALWSKYLTEVEHLRDFGQITDDDVALLRHRQESENALMKETLGRPTDVDAEAVLTVLERVQAQIRKPLEGQLDLLQTEAASAERAHAEVATLKSELEETKATVDELAAVVDGEERRRSRALDQISKRSQAFGRNVRWCLMIVTIGVVLCWAVIYTSGPLWVKGVQALLAVATLIGGFAGPGQSLENSVSNWRRGRLLAQNALVSEEADTLDAKHSAGDH